MHTKPMSENEGTFQDGWAPADGVSCWRCGAKTVLYRVWSNGAYEDDKYKCTTCGKIWWVDGIDS